MNGPMIIDTNLQKKTTKALFCGKVKKTHAGMMFVVWN